MQTMRFNFDGYLIWCSIYGMDYLISYTLFGKFVVYSQDIDFYFFILFKTYLYGVVYNQCKILFFSIALYIYKQCNINSNCYLPEC